MTTTIGPSISTRRKRIVFVSSVFPLQCFNLIVVLIGIVA